MTPPNNPNPQATELAKLQHGGQVLDSKAAALLRMVEEHSPAAGSDPKVQQLQAAVQREEATRFSPANSHSPAAMIHIERAELEAIHNDMSEVAGEESGPLTPQPPALVSLATHAPHLSASGESILGKARRGKDVRREREQLEEEERIRKLLNQSREQGRGPLGIA